MADVEFTIWILDFGFWTLVADFGFWAVVDNFGFWTLGADFGFLDKIQNRPLVSKIREKLTYVYFNCRTTFESGHDISQS